MLKQTIKEAAHNITAQVKKAKKGKKNEHTYKAVLSAFTDLAYHLNGF